MAAHASTPDSRAAAWRQQLLFYVGVPVAIGLLFGWMKAGRTSEWPMVLSLGFWITNVWSSWLICDLGTRVAAVMARPWRMSLAVVLAIGFAIVQGLSYPVNRGIAGLFQTYLVAADLHRPLPRMQWFTVFKSVLPGLLLWVGVNLALYRWLGMPRYGFVPAVHGATARARDVEATTSSIIASGDASATPSGTPTRGDAPPPVTGNGVPAAAVPRAGTLPMRNSPLLTRLPPKLGTRLLAITAEEHYLRVQTDRGSALVLYRMGDAVRELEAWPGLQVHRSHWVALDAVERVERAQGQMTLVLTGGLRVPVSRSFRRAVEERQLPARAAAPVGT